MIGTQLRDAGRGLYRRLDFPLPTGEDLDDIKKICYIPEQQMLAPALS